MRSEAVTTLAVMVVAVALASCGTNPKATARSEPSNAPTANPSPTASDQQMAALVRTYAEQIGGELAQAPASVMVSSNPYDYLDSRPTYGKVVALGPPALPAIAQYILDRRAYGLDGYILAIAGEAVWGSHGTPLAPGAKSWETGEQWAHRYLAWANDHPSGD